MDRSLLVDDVYTTRSTIERVLSRVGSYEMCSVGSGLAAVVAATASTQI